ncbi:MAG: fatty acid desaturase, partial [Bacteroidota bacterium]
MLRYKADRRTLAIVSTYFSLLAISWVLFDDLGWGWIALLVVVNAVFSFFCAVIVHNTIHAAVFKKPWMNRVFQLILSLTY